MTVHPHTSERSRATAIADGDAKTRKQSVNASPRLPDAHQQNSAFAEQSIASPTWSAGTIFGAIIIIAFFVMLALAAEYYDVALFEECYVNCDT